MAMEMQELTAILDTVKSVAATTGYVGIAWLLMHYAVQALSIVMWPLALAMTAKFGFRALHSYVTKPPQPDGNTLEKTKQVELETSRDVCRLQLSQIAAAHGMTYSRYSGLDDKDLRILTMITKTEQTR